MRAQLEKILASPAFRASEGLSRFLRFIVDQTLLGHGDWLKESVVGVEVFRRGKSFDPRMDAIVRVDARRLRAKLGEYYETLGQNDPVYIEVRKGSYAPVFGTRPPAPAPRPQGPESRETTAALDPGRQFSSIAVLPFINLCADPENEYFSDGLTEEVIAALTRIPTLRVIARSTAFRYQGKAHDIQKVGAELRVEMVLEGSVRKTGDRLRISAQLIDVSTSFHIWSRTFEGDTKDIFALQGEISAAIAGLVKAQVPEAGLNGDSAGNRSPHHPGTHTGNPAGNPAAYDLYLRGIYFENIRSSAALAKGLDYLKQAAELDPRSALILARLADSYALQAIFGVQTPHDVLPAAKAAAKRALEVDSSFAEAHAASAFVSAVYDWDWPAAQKEFRRALQLNFNIPDIHHRYAVYYLVPQGRLDEALEQLRIARHLDPLSLVLNAAECLTLYAARRYDEAIARGQNTLELEPNHSLTHLFLVSSYQQKGMLEEALQAAETGVRLGGRTPISLRQLANTYALMGRRDEAFGIAAELEGYADPPCGSIAEIYSTLNELDRAFEWWARAVATRDPGLLYLRVSPGFDMLRHDARYDALVISTGLAQ